MITPDQIRNSARFDAPLRAEALLELADRLEAAEAWPRSDCGERDKLVRALRRSAKACRGEVEIYLEKAADMIETDTATLSTLPDTWQQAMEEAVIVCELERVSSDGILCDENIAYNRAIGHCVSALRALAEKEFNHEQR